MVKYVSVMFEFEVLFPVDVGKAPLLRNNDFLTTGELIAGTTKASWMTRPCNGRTGGVGQYLPGRPFRSVFPKPPGTGRHVDAEGVERVNTDP